jgi:hypothetical protein
MPVHGIIVETVANRDKRHPPATRLGHYKLRRAWLLTVTLWMVRKSTGSLLYCSSPSIVDVNTLLVTRALGGEVMYLAPVFPQNFGMR